MRRVALLDPVGDAGIGGYTHELAQAITAAGVHVDVYTTADAFAARLPHRYAIVPAFGAIPLEAPALAELLRAAAAPRAAAAAAGTADPASPQVLDAYLDVLHRREAARVAAREAAREGATLVASPLPCPPTAGTGPASRLRASVASPHTDALAEHLCAAGYDTVWTQWPDLQPYGDNLRRHCADAGMRVVHTVHNVLPHERTASDTVAHAQVYDSCDALIVHSRQAATSLASHFPATADRVIESRHGTYTLYPRIDGARARVRERLGIARDGTVVLLFGGVRPYKNVEAVLGTLADDGGSNVTVVVAGWEWGYDEVVSGDRLGRTRRLVQHLGVRDRVRLLPGPFGIAQTSALFEASDIVALPYLESFGSGVLCLGMTFQRHLLCTRTGGMAEYLDDYPAHTLLDGADGNAVRRGLRRAAAALSTPGADPTIPESLSWRAIVATLMPRLAAVRTATVSG
jgi:glycosyltransferase involved in cell wall biosynthesis